jgi:EmrB/QacA subfamily drug resistance transporter
MPTGGTGGIVPTAIQTRVATPDSFKREDLMPAISNRFHQRGTLVVVCLATAMLMLDIAVVNTALPYLARDLHAGLTGVQWVVDAYTLALAAVVLSAGSISDRRGRRRVFARGIVLFTASSLACAEASSIAVLDVARAVQGVAAALMFASSLAILADAFPGPRERSGALAAYGATIGGAFAVGPAVGGALTSGLGWRAVFFINVPLGIAGLLATAAWLRESRDPRARRLDWPGQLLLTGGLFLLVLALLRGNTDGWGSAPILAELLGAVGLLVAFVAVERRSPVPMLPMSLFGRRDFTAAQVAAFTISASFFALYLYMTLYLQDILHLSALKAGLAYIPGSLLLFVVSGASAGLSQRITPGRLVAGGLVLVSIGLALVTMTGARSSWTAILPGDLLVCVGTGIFNPALGAIALGAASDANSGLLAGVNDAFRQGGLAIGVACFGALVPAGAALGHGSARAYMDGFHHALLCGAALAAVGAVATVALLRNGRAVPSSARAFDPTAEPAAEVV